MTQKFVHTPVYIYEVHGGRTWGGDSDEFCGFGLVVTKEPVSVKDFTAMFVKAAELPTVKYGKDFLRKVAKRLCTPEEKGKRLKVPWWRTIEFDSYRWSVNRSVGSSLLFDNGDELPLDLA